MMAIRIRMFLELETESAEESKETREGEDKEKLLSFIFSA